jgi:O-antigen ligase
MSNLGLLLGLGAVACLGLLLLEAMIRRTDVGAALVLGLLVFQEIFPHVSLSFDAGPFSVGPQDLLLVVMAAAVVARLLRAERLTTQQRLLLVIAALVIWAVARGIAPFGLPAAVNEARRSLRFVFVALYFAAIEPRRELLDRIGWLWVLAAAALVGITVVRWLAGSVGVYGGVLGAGGSMRVIPSDPTLLVAQGALIAFPLLAERGRGVIRYTAPAFLVAVVLLQHRTVWIAAAFGVAYLLFRERALAKRAFSALLVATFLFTALMFTVFGGNEDVVSEQLATSAQSTGTFEWRVDGWTVLLADTIDAGINEVAVGRPFGTGWTRTMSSGGVVEVSPHNYYVEAFLRIGLVGLILLGLIYASALRATAQASKTEGGGLGSLLTANGLHVAIAVQLFYYITYAPDMSQAMLLGIGAAVAAANTRERRAVTTQRSEPVR